MLAKKIKYTDYNGVDREEEFYFNLTKAELMEMEMSENGGLEGKIKQIINTQDAKSIMDLFKEIIVKAYGVKSNDGKRFIKNQEVKDEFVQSEAYSELFMELATNSDAAQAFINGIIPKEIAKQAAKQSMKQLANK